MDQLSPINPVTAWSVEAIRPAGGLIVNFSFSLLPIQEIDEKTKTPDLLLSVKQAKDLIEALQKSLNAAEAECANNSRWP